MIIHTLNTKPSFRKGSMKIQNLHINIHYPRRISFITTIGKSHTEWVLNQQAPPPPVLLGNKVPFEQQLIGHNPRTQSPKHEKNY